MADQPKKKTAAQRGVRNDDRRNRKAFKTKPGDYRPKSQEYRGSHTRSVRLSELEKALLGGGAMRRIMKPLPGSIIHKD